MRFHRGPSLPRAAPSFARAAEGRGAPPARQIKKAGHKGARPFKIHPPSPNSVSRSGLKPALQRLSDLLQIRKLALGPLALRVALRI